YRVTHYFGITQEKGEKPLLIELIKFFGCGWITKENDNSTIEFKVTDRLDLINKIFPFFDKYPLLTKKKEDYLKFKKIVYILHENKPLKLVNLIEIENLIKK